MERNELGSRAAADEKEKRTGGETGVDDGLRRAGAYLEGRGHERLVRRWPRPPVLRRIGVKKLPRQARYIRE